MSPINRNGASRGVLGGGEELKLPFTYTVVLFLSHDDTVFVIVSVILVVSIL